MNFAVCPDDGAHLRADPSHHRGDRPLVMKCPACGKRFTLTEAGMVEAEPEDGQGQA